MSYKHQSTMRITKPAPAPVRVRPVALNNLRAFEVVARHLNFRSAAEELALTQPAVSRQIQALELDVGGALFERSTRAVGLTPAGRALLQVVAAWTERLDVTVRNIRGGLARKSVAITTFASFASTWLIPKLEAFQRLHADIDIRVDASDAFINLENNDMDLALRYGTYEQMPKGAIRLFDEVIAPMASPWLLKLLPQIQTASDLSKLTLIELSDVTNNQTNWLTWEGWMRQHDAKIKPAARWLRFNYAYQTVQAALAGQGVVLARLPMVAESLKSGDLVEPLPSVRLTSPMAYWLIARSGSLDRSEVLSFSNWLQKQARETRSQMRASIKLKIS
jgi:LysR family transcriptional regulator, glycine cleavage system transcriptional activator